MKNKKKIEFTCKKILQKIVIKNKLWKNNELGGKEKKLQYELNSLLR